MELVETPCGSFLGSLSNHLHKIPGDMGMLSIKIEQFQYCSVKLLGHVLLWGLSDLHSKAVETRLQESYLILFV